MEGENFVSFKGVIDRAELRKVGQKNTSLFKGTLAIPIAGRTQYEKIAAWAATAEAMNELPEGAFIHIHGHIESRSYDGKCRNCGGSEKKYWTEVVVDNFVQLDAAE